jgi:hypothetical protein
MEHLNIHAKHTFWGHGYVKVNHLHRVSTRIRAEEIVEYLGAKLNQPRAKGDVCVFVKPRYLSRIKDGDYVDILDGNYLIDKLIKKPKVRVIAMCQTHYNYLRQILPNEITLIYHHHINFERTRHKKNAKLLGGLVGTPSPAIYKVCDKLKAKLAAIDVDFNPYFTYRTRRDMINYYKTIDFLVVWAFQHMNSDNPYRHPTKIINAASFGVPSLARPMDGYAEFEGLYLPIQNSDDVVREAERLKNDSFYNEFADTITAEAEKYHISRTSEAYKLLVLQ